MKGMLSILTFSIAATAAGSALADEKTYDLAGFEGVSVSAGVKAIVTVGGDYSVRAESSSDGLEKLEIRVRHGELDIGRKSHFMSFGRHNQVTVYVSMPALMRLDVSSGSETEATGVAGGPFSVDASSGADASITGSCDALSLDVSSGASVDASELKCKTGSADASSGGSARIFVSDSITADASSGGSIRVYGKPTNSNTDTSSGGSVHIVR